MKQFPATPPVSDAPEELLSGHLWLLELIDGRRLRFQLQESGLLRVADADRVYEDPDKVPLPLRRAVRHLRRHLNRDALRAAVADVEAVVFFGVATTRESVPYDLDSMPPFLGTDVWSGESEAFRPPDAANGIFGRLGLDSVNPLEREYNSRDFTLNSYEIPQSAWYDGPAAGVVLRNKQGHRGVLTNSAIETDSEDHAGDHSSDGDHAGDHSSNGDHAVGLGAEELAESYASPADISSVTAALDTANQPATVDTITDRLLETIGRERPDRVTGSDSIDTTALRSAIASRVQQRRQG